MKISEDQVLYVAHLARLTITDEERNRFTTQLNDILGYMDVLNTVDTGDVDPMSRAASGRDAFREDQVRPSLDVGVSLANAPGGDGGFFTVPRIIE